MSFANLKAQSGNTEKLTKAIAALQTNYGSDEKDNYWKPEADKVGNGSAVIRFLPTPEADGDGAPWVKIYSHGFQGPGGWLIDNCPTTNNGQVCPVCEHNTTLWNSGIEANKEIVRKQKRKLNYVSNIYVVSDPKNPDNEGKVFLFKFGKKIFDKISEAMNPTFDDIEKFNPFDFWAGANFKLRFRVVDKQRSYADSAFDTCGPLFNDDAKMEKIYKQEYSLSELVSEDNFKSYDQLKNRLDKVLGLNGSAPKTTVEKIKEELRSTPRKEVSMSEEEDDLDYFAKLAEED